MRRIFISAFILVAVNSFAGGESSGGGKSVVCRDPDKKIIGIELLDIFEGRALEGLEPKSLGDGVDENLAVIKTKLAATFKDAVFMRPVYDWIEIAQKDFHLLPSGVALLPIDDAAEVAIPVGCELEQLAFYDEDKRLLVNRELWNALDDLNKAALFVHEGIYRVERLHGDKNSRRARRVVAHLFSDFQFNPILGGIPKDALFCDAKDASDQFASFEFYRYTNPTKPDWQILQFIHFKNRFPYSEMHLNSFQWPWDEDFSDIYMETQSNFELFPGLMLRRNYNSKGKLIGYYFDDDDKKYLIKCRKLKN